MEKSSSFAVKFLNVWIVVEITLCFKGSTNSIQVRIIHLITFQIRNIPSSREEVRNVRYSMTICIGFAKRKKKKKRTSSR